ncbi:hypothetical protein ACJMK2_007956 [Sinanodonta woodiana]|uniref:Uncharacterized protein n=1 Tax=Sinanodonta woodiana TaxID=1069815 RepID=A0ABD3VLN4_SINWO
MPNESLYISAKVYLDGSLKDYQMYSYDARVPNEPGRIELQVQDNSLYFLPHEGYIEVAVRIQRVHPAGNYDADANVGFVSNGIMALFNSARYLIDGKEIEAIQSDLGVATTILGLVTYSDDYQRTVGPSMMFHKDTADTADDNPLNLKDQRNIPPRLMTLMLQL